MDCDLLIKGGRLLDPASGLDDQRDVAVADGRICAIEPAIDEASAAEVLDVSGADRYVVAGLLDIHTHVAYGATTPGVGMACSVPDVVGVQSGVTTLVDAGSVGVANFGAFPAHILPAAATRVLCFLNIGSHAHSMPDVPDITCLGDVNLDAVDRCIEANPGTVAGLKLRLVGATVESHGPEIIAALKEVAGRHGLPVMVHIGDAAASHPDGPSRMSELTRTLLTALDRGDILTHLCTPNPGGVATDLDVNAPLLLEARERGVVLDAALGRGNFGFEAACRLRRRGVDPDTISSDVTGAGQHFQSLLECMAKFIAVGYSLADVVTMTTTNAAAAIGASDRLGSLDVGRVADITIFDRVEGEFEFVDSIGCRFEGDVGLVPVQTIREGRMHAPRWGTHPWGWLPARRTGKEPG